MRRLLVVLAIAACVVLAHQVALAQPAFAQQADLTEHFTREEIARSQAYRARAYALSFAILGVTLAVTGALGLGRGARALNAWARRRVRRWWARAAVLVAFVLGVPALITLPLTLGRYQHARAYGLATDEPPERLRDLAIATGIEYALGLAGAVLVVLAARKLPRAWPLVVAPGAAAVTIVLVFVYPLVIEPAFNTFTPADRDTRARVLAVAERASIDVDEVLIADASRRTSTLNAYVSGFGSTRRVVLYDTLVEQLPPDELQVVVAHELAHEVHGDVVKGTAYAAAGMVAAVVVVWGLLSSARVRAFIGVQAAGDPGVIPFLAFVVLALTLVATPVASTISRRIEVRADRFALQVTGDARAMIDLQVRLARSNISDLDPHPVIYTLFFTHPSTRERIEMALETA